MGTVVITGADSPLGRRVATLAAGDPRVEAVVALAERSVVGLPDDVDVRRIDLGTDDVKPHLEGAESVLHLATSVPSSPAAPTHDVERARRVFEAAGDAAVPHLVVLSSATVYGAWPNNPVPLTEEATLRPNPGFAFAAERAEIERLASEWRGAHPSVVLTVLRPARTAGSDHREWLVPALRPGPAVPETADEPPVQFLDVGDLAAAIDLGRSRRLDGVFNVAPDGSVPGDEVRPLIGAPLKVPLPERVAGRLLRWGFRWGLGPTPPELLAYTLHPWTIANDRLRAQGWSPTVTNEEACVDAFEANAWATLSPRRRQEIALGLAGAGLAAVATGGVLAARRLLRSRG